MTDLEVKSYITKPVYVKAVRITEDNLEAVAAWCKGRIMEEEQNGVTVQYVKTRVFRKLPERYTKGFPGDLIVKRGSEYKSFTTAAFLETYTDGEEIPLSFDDPDVRPALFDEMVTELQTPHVTKIQMGSHEQIVRTPAAGVPLRGFDGPDPRTILLSEAVKIGDPTDIVFITPTGE